MTVLTIGTWAIPHLGHAAFLRRCEAFGTVIVGVNSDAFVEQYKAETPMFRETERMAIIAALGYETHLNDGPGRELIEAIRPDVLTIGTDWARRRYLTQIDVDQDFLDEHGITLAYVPMRPIGISSSLILERARR